MRSVSGMWPESTFSRVVLPEPVPPEMTMFSRAFTQAFRNSAIVVVSVLNSISRASVSRSLGNRRMVICRAVDGHRPHHRVHSRSIRQARIHGGTVRIHVPSEGQDDAIDDAQQVRLVVKADAR